MVFKISFNFSYLSLIIDQNIFYIKTCLFVKILFFIFPIVYYKYKYIIFIYNRIIRSVEIHQNR
jgi:hypothetical protein